MKPIYATLLSCTILTSGALAEDSAPKPATATLLNGRIEYAPPAGWTPVKSNLPADTAAVYVAEDHDGYFALQVLPENAAVSPAAAQKIVAQLRINHKKAGQEIVEAPKIEKDAHFSIKIHERYKTKEGKTADETHLYRQVAGRAMELDVQSLSDDPAHVQAVEKVGEDVLLSATWKGAKPGKTKAN